MRYEFELSPGDELMIGDDCRMKFLRVDVQRGSGGKFKYYQARLAFDADRSVKIDRLEVLMRRE